MGYLAEELLEKEFNIAQLYEIYKDCFAQLENSCKKSLEIQKDLDDFTEKFIDLGFELEKLLVDVRVMLKNIYNNPRILHIQDSVDQEPELAIRHFKNNALTRLKKENVK